MNDRNAYFYLPRRSGGTWLTRIALGVIGIAIAAMAFFFVAVALCVGAAAALVLGVRWWWHTRRLRAAARTHGPIEGEYTIVERDRLR
jgi:hypothetical protein